MANNIIQYLKDTRGELRHVAWPTQSQTIVYTVIIAGISIFVALYLGLFDYIFTSGLGKVLDVIPQTNPVTVTQTPVVATTTASTPLPAPTFNTNLGGTPVKTK